MTEDTHKQLNGIDINILGVAACVLAIVAPPIGLVVGGVLWRQAATNGGRQEILLAKIAVSTAVAMLAVMLIFLALVPILDWLFGNVVSAVYS